MAKNMPENNGKERMAGTGESVLIERVAASVRTWMPMRKLKRPPSNDGGYGFSTISLF